MPRLLLLAVLLLASNALAQSGAVPSMEADQSDYAYGETIELRYSITNEGDEPFMLFGASVGCQAEFVFDSFDSKGTTPCTADERPYTFAPGETGTWIWQVRPGSLGLPESDGAQTVTGYWGYGGGPNTLPATATFEAPQYLGGRIIYLLASGVTLDEVQDVIDALNAVDIEDGSGGMIWEISGTTLDDAVAEYGDDPRFAFFEPYRLITYTSVVFTDDEDGASPIVPALTSAHPNPFVASTSFALTVPESGPARVEVFDMLGRRIAVLHDGPLAAGPEHRFTFYAAGLPSGLYVVRASGEGFTQTRRVTLNR